MKKSKPSKTKPRKAKKRPVTTALVVAEKPDFTNKSLAKSQQFKLNKEMIDTLMQAKVIPEGTPPPMIAFYIQFCNQSGLSPFLRQVHLVPRKDSRTNTDTYTIQTGIDGFRAIANRSNNYAGSDDIKFDNEQNPQIATATVYKMVQGQRVAFTATARMDEYKPKNDRMAFMWNDKPHVMLGKCAEALALRKAFSQLSGVYSDEEMQQAEDEPTPAPTTIAPGVTVETFDPAAQTIQFEQYSGQTWASVPRDYLAWIVKSATNKQTRHKAEATLKYLDAFAAASPKPENVVDSMFGKEEQVKPTATAVQDAKFEDLPTAAAKDIEVKSSTLYAQLAIKVTQADTPAKLTLLTKQVNDHANVGSLAAKHGADLIMAIDRKYEALKGAKK